MSIIGIAYDKYSANLKAQVFTDVLKLAEVGLDQVEIIGDQSDKLKDLLKYCGVSVVIGREPPTWRVYVYESEPTLPDYAENIVRKDMSIKTSREGRLIPNAEHYPSLERQSDQRVVSPGLSIDINRPPPINPKNAPYSLPRDYTWQPFI